LSSIKPTFNPIEVKLQLHVGLH